MFVPMIVSHRLSLQLVVALSIASASLAHAQGPASPSEPMQTSPSTAAAADSGAKPDDAGRPATTTFFGDTGLWFVPTAEILGHGKWSVSGYRRGSNYVQGYSNVADFAGTFAVGVNDRVEIFGSLLIDTRIDRDTRPLFGGDSTFGGFVDRNPRMNTTWSGDNLGDLYVGAKFNLMSEARRNPVALAVRGLVKVPTGKVDAGVSTGKADAVFDVIVSKEAGKVVDVSGYGGYEVRGQPDGFSTPGGAFRWGGGAALPSRSPLRAVTEVNGVMPSSDTASLAGGTTLVGTDGSASPLTVGTGNLTRLTAGLTLQLRGGFFVGGGLSWNMPRQARNIALASDDPFADYWDWQVRIGFHPGVKAYVAPPPPPPPPLPPPPPAPPAHTLTAKADCDPCTVEAGRNSTVTATVQDSINCAVTYRWSAPSGTFANAAERQTLWTAPQQAGSVPVTVGVTCPSDNKTAAATVNIQVIRPAPKTYTFEDVHFDFDRYSLRPEATRVLDEAVNALTENPSLAVTIQGYTCNIGTAEYNLALGNRRAEGVRNYLVSRGVSASRLRTISYGEERAKYDNGREETRRLNRRAALGVRLQ